jgi:hypothetical protein
MSATVIRYTVFIVLFLAGMPACSEEKPIQLRREPAPPIIIKPQHEVLTPEQRGELGFPPDIIEKVERSAGSEAEPFFISVLVRSENLKGEKGLEEAKLAGFSVRTSEALDLIRSYRNGLRVRGFLIFRSRNRYGDLPDIVTVVRGYNSYDILKVQGTEAPNYRLSTRMITSWLRRQQHLASFFIIGAGQDWLEARFVKPPRNMLAFAGRVNAFAPDVVLHGPGTVKKLAEEMKRINGFRLEWD